MLSYTFLTLGLDARDDFNLIKIKILKVKLILSLFIAKYCTNNIYS